MLRAVALLAAVAILPSLVAAQKEPSGVDLDNVAENYVKEASEYLKEARAQLSEKAALDKIDSLNGKEVRDFEAAQSGAGEGCVKDYVTGLCAGSFLQQRVTLHQSPTAGVMRMFMGRSMEAPGLVTPTLTGTDSFERITQAPLVWLKLSQPKIE